MIWTDIAWWVWTLILYSLGILAAIDALWNGRTAQGTVAWVTSLILMPIVAVPAYIFFGSRRFHGFKKARQVGIQAIAQLTSPQYTAPECVQDNDKSLAIPALEALARTRQWSGNNVELLIDGPQTFSSIFDAIENAKKSVLVQFYIVHNDKLGKKLQQALIERAKAGVNVYFLYDEIGSSKLPKRYIKELTSEGVRCSKFNTLQIRHRLQLNFRNHRKLVVVDGNTCFIGGHNVGDEYLGKHPDIGEWRDTHLKIKGPATLTAQRSFIEDWYWAQHYIPKLQWQTPQPQGKSKVLVMSGGPADKQESMSLSFVQLINNTQSRLWIATPYFVPDLKVFGALELAAKRGVDIRILLPLKSDNKIVALATHSYVEDLLNLGIQFFQYEKGFLHQKTLLSDSALSLIGSANFDNRSLRINFELNALIECESVALQVYHMLNKDFDNSRKYTLPKSVFQRSLAKAARLLSPIL